MDLYLLVKTDCKNPCHFKGSVWWRWGVPRLHIADDEAEGGERVAPGVVGDETIAREGEIVLSNGDQVGYGLVTCTQTRTCFDVFVATPQCELRAH